MTQVGATARNFDAVGNTLSGIPGYGIAQASYDVRNRLSEVAQGAAELAREFGT